MRRPLIVPSCLVRRPARRRFGHVCDLSCGEYYEDRLDRLAAAVAVAAPKRHTSADRVKR
jgi:hypothetical protein